MDRPPAPARLAATLLLLRPAPAADAGFEVLMVRRHAQQVFGSALVFPGGAVDPGDGDDDWLPFVDGADGLDRTARALRIAGLRETFEETAILVAGGAAASAGSFAEQVRGGGRRLALDALVPFAHWITPVELPRRFDTHFFLARAPEGAVAVSDGIETVAAEWIAPDAVLARAVAGDLMVPTRLSLTRLAESVDIAAALAAARARPPVAVLPRIERRGDAVVTVIPADAGHGETELVERRPA